MLLDGATYQKGGTTMYTTDQEKQLERYQKIHENSVQPLADIYETEDTYIIKLDMPGVDKNDMDITLEKDLLSISGNRPKDVRTQENKAFYQEFAPLNYFRAFRLANDAVDEQKIEANLNNGVLTLTLQKSEKTKPRKIEIKSA